MYINKSFIHFHSICIIFNIILYSFMKYTHTHTHTHPNNCILIYFLALGSPEKGFRWVLVLDTQQSHSSKPDLAFSECCKSCLELDTSEARRGVHTSHSNIAI